MRIYYAVKPKRVALTYCMWYMLKVLLRPSPYSSMNALPNAMIAF